MKGSETQRKRNYVMKLSLQPILNEESSGGAKNRMTERQRSLALRIYDILLNLLDVSADFVEVMKVELKRNESDSDSHSYHSSPPPPCQLHIVVVVRRLLHTDDASEVSYFCSDLDVASEVARQLAEKIYTVMHSRASRGMDESMNWLNSLPLRYPRPAPSNS